MQVVVEKLVLVLVMVIAQVIATTVAGLHVFLLVYIFNVETSIFAKNAKVDCIRLCSFELCATKQLHLLSQKTVN